MTRESGLEEVLADDDRVRRSNRIMIRYFMIDMF